MLLTSARRRAAALAALAAPAAGWRLQADCDEAHDLRCCNGWRPACRSGCPHTCIVLAKMCNDDTQEWSLKCAKTVQVGTLVNTGVGVVSQTGHNLSVSQGNEVTTFDDSGNGVGRGPLASAALPLFVQAVKAAGDDKPRQILVTFIGSSIEQVCSTMRDETWMDNFNKEFCGILGLDPGTVEHPLPAECEEGAPRRPARAAGREAQAQAQANDDVVLVRRETWRDVDAAAPATAATTSGAAAATTSDDPITSFNGKQIQFYLPHSMGRLTQPTSLMTCSDVDIQATAFGSGIPGDTQQWFRSFDVYHRGKLLLHVGVANTSMMPAAAGGGASAAAAAARKRAAGLLADAAAEVAAQEAGDVSVAQIVKGRVAAALQSMHFARQGNGRGQGQQVPLTTLNVTVLGRRVKRTEWAAVRDGDAEAFVATTQDPDVRVSGGFSETVAIGVGDVGLEFTSQVAEKFHGSEAVLMTHLDLRVTQLRASQCVGPLPEIWGIRPMSKRTAYMLLPPKI